MMIIYHIGTPRIMFLGALKLTTIFVFGFFAVVVIPGCVSADMPLWYTTGCESPPPNSNHHPTSPSSSNSPARAVAVASTIPFLGVWYLTSPMVVWIHMRVPDKYRQSKHMLGQYLDAPPADAPLAITNMGAVFKPRISHVRLSDLRPERKRFGLVNYTRDTTKENAQRKWWMFRAVGGFRIEDETTTGSKTKWIWDLVAKQIRQRAGEGKKTRRA